MDRREAFDYIMNGKGSMESFYKIHHCVDDDDWEEGQRVIIKETGCDENTAKWVWADIKNKLCPNKYEQSKPSQPTQNLPTCPICGSTNLTKLSNVGKAAKVGFFGIFGAGDLGKTWKCKNCGSKF